jgi:hypothetical protein
MQYNAATPYEKSSNSVGAKEPALVLRSKSKGFQLCFGSVRRLRFIYLWGYENMNSVRRVADMTMSSDGIECNRFQKTCVFKIFIVQKRAMLSNVVTQKIRIISQAPSPLRLLGLEISDLSV